MKVFKIGDVVTIKDQYDPGCDGSDYPHVLPSSCKGAIGVITAVCSEAVDPQEKRKKMYNHDDYLYEVEIKITPTLNFNETLRRVRWHGSCFKEYDHDTLLYRKGDRVLINRIPGVADWRERYSPYATIEKNVCTENKHNFRIIVECLNKEDEDTTAFYVSDEDVEPLADDSPEVTQKSSEEQSNVSSEIDDFLPIIEELDTPPEPQVSKKPIITVSIEEVKITIPKTVLPIIRI